MKLIKTIEFKHKSKSLVLLGIIFFSTLIFRIFLVPFEVPVKLDAINYFIFAYDFAKTGIMPSSILETNDGWSMFLSFIFKIIGLDDFNLLNSTQRVTSIVLSSLTIIPIYLICKKYTNSNNTILGVTLFAFNPYVILNSLLGITESLYIFLISFSIYFIIINDKKWIYLSPIFVGLASIVRYEGLLIIVPICIFHVLLNRHTQKKFFRVVIIFLIFIILLLPIYVIRTENNGIDGLTSHVFAGIKYTSSLEDDSIEKNLMENNEQSKLSNFSINFFSNIFKYFFIISFPFLLIFSILGIINNIKIKNFNSLKLLIFLIFLLIPSLYAYGRNIEETRYLLVLIPILTVFSSESISFFSKNLKKVVPIILIIIIVSGMLFSIYNITDYQYEKEIYIISKYLVQNANGVNAYKGNNYDKIAFEELSTDSKNIEKNSFSLPTKIVFSDSTSIRENILNGRNNGLTHLVVTENNRETILNDIISNPDNYPYLNKVFDSKDFKFKNLIYIYKIDYELIK